MWLSALLECRISPIRQMGYIFRPALVLPSCAPKRLLEGSLETNAGNRSVSKSHLYGSFGQVNWLSEVYYRGKMGKLRPQGIEERSDPRLAVQVRIFIYRQAYIYLRLPNIRPPRPSSKSVAGSGIASMLMLSMSMLALSPPVRADSWTLYS